MENSTFGHTHFESNTHFERIELEENVGTIINLDELEIECFLCADVSESEYVQLTCCQRSDIHRTCLFNIFLNCLNRPYDVMPCPLCRQDIRLKNYFQLNEIIDIFSKYDYGYKRKMLQSFANIINFNFIDYNHELHIDNETSTVSVSRRCMYDKICLFGFIIILILFILALISSDIYKNTS